MPHARGPVWPEGVVPPVEPFEDVEPCLTLPPGITELTHIELGRALRRRVAELTVSPGAALRRSLSGIGIVPISHVVAEFARTIDPPMLRPLDAIHLASAITIGAHELWTYDQRLAEAAELVGFRVRAPA